MAAPAGFEFPSYYSLPPFFTLQPVLETRERQTKLWRSLILDYQKARNSSLLDISAALASPLCNNEAIGRRLNREALTAFIDDLASTGHAEWLDAGKTQACVMWRTPEEWGNMMHRWAAVHGMLNSVCTVYELHSGDDSEGEEFHGLEETVVMRALESLRKRGKAQVFQSSTGDTGVKFLE